MRRGNERSFRRTTDVLGPAWAINSAIGIAGYGALSFISGSVDGPFTAITIPFRVAVGLLSLLFIGRAFLLKRRPVTWKVLGFLVFMGLYTFRMYLDLDRLGTDQFSKQILFLFGVAIVPGLAMNLASERKHARLLVNSLLVMYTVASILGVRGTTEESMETGRLLANQYFNPIDLGHAGLSLLLICAYRLLRTRISMGNIGSIALYGAGGTLGATVLALSGSRGPVTAGVICLVIMTIASFRWRSSSGAVAIRRPLILIAVLASGVVGISVAGRFGGTVVNRLSSLSDTRTGDTESRLPMYQEAFEAMLDNPITGVTTLVSNGMYPHNAILEAGMAMGVGGAIAMTAFLLLISRRSIRLVSEGGETGLIGLLAVQQVVACQFSGAIWSDDNIWTFGLLILGTPALTSVATRATRVWRSSAGELTTPHAIQTSPRI